MFYTPQPGESLVTIAGKLTYSPDYAFALAELNGMAGEGQTWTPEQQFNLVSSPLVRGSVVEIPDDWLRVTPDFLQKPGILSDGFFKWAGLALALVALAK